MVALWNRADHYNFMLLFVLSSFFFFSSPNLSRRRLDVCHTSTHGYVALVRFKMQVWNLLHAACWKHRTQKSRQKSPSEHHRMHNFVGLYLRNEGTYQQSEKTVKQQWVLHMSPQYGELRPTSGWDRFTSLGHPSKFQRPSRLGSITAPQ